MNNKESKLRNLEKKFGAAQTAVEQIDDLVAELGINEIDVEPQGALVPVPDNLPAVPSDELIELFSTQQLMGDFVMVRSNLIKLINTGQNILASCQILDLSDLKASQLEALSNLQRTIADNTRALLEIYKDMAAIEKARNAGKAKTVEVPAGNVMTGPVSQTNIVFQGNTADLMKLINNSKVIDCDPSDNN